MEQSDTNMNPFQTHCWTPGSLSTPGRKGAADAVRQGRVCGRKVVASRDHVGFLVARGAGGGSLLGASWLVLCTAVGPGLWTCSGPCPV